LTLRTQPAKISETLNDEVMIGKATETVVPLMATSRNDRLVTPKTIYFVTIIV
jgi:hypothetical protein